MTTPIMTPLPQQDFRRTPWKNGGGVTIDIAGAYGAAEGSWAGTIWRFGRTAITVPAPFSDLSGYERMQLVVEGAGLVLEGPAEEIDLRLPLRPVRYDGGIPLVSRLEQGPVEVLNLIADRRLCEIELAVLDAGDSRVLAAGTHILYAPRGEVSGLCAGARCEVAPGDALQLDSAAGLSLQIEAGPGILASIRLR